MAWRSSKTGLIVVVGGPLRPMTRKFMSVSFRSATVAAVGLAAALLALTGCSSSNQHKATSAITTGGATPATQATTFSSAPTTSAVVTPVTSKPTTHSAAPATIAKKVTPAPSGGT